MPTNTNQITAFQQAKNNLAKLDLSSLPAQIPSKKFVRIAQTAISDPRIADLLNQKKLDTTSLYAACTKCASDGLVLDNREATLLTFYNKTKKINEAQYIPMVAGLMKKARNTGEIRSIIAKVVYKEDKFEQWVDEHGEHFKHVPCEDSTKRGVPTKVYALGITKDGTQLEVLEKEDINAIASHSKNAYQYDPQKGDWFAEWWKKAAIRRVCKYLPSSSDLDRVFAHDNENFDLDDRWPNPHRR